MHNAYMHNAFEYMWRGVTYAGHHCKSDACFSELDCITFGSHSYTVYHDIHVALNLCKSSSKITLGNIHVMKFMWIRGTWALIIIA